MTKHLTKEDKQMENKHKKRCSTAYVISVFLNKTTIPLHTYYNSQNSKHWQ